MTGCFQSCLLQTCYMLERVKHVFNLEESEHLISGNWARLMWNAELNYPELSVRIIQIDKYLPLQNLGGFLLGLTLLMPLTSKRERSWVPSVTQT